MSYVNDNKLFSRFASLCANHSVPGNLLTVVALLRCQKLRSHATTAFVISLAASDLLSVTSTNGLAITDALRDYAGSKLAKPLERHESSLAGVSLHLKVEHRGGGLHDEAHAGLDAHVAEITATTKDKRIVRAQPFETGI